MMKHFNYIRKIALGILCASWLSGGLVQAYTAEVQPELSTCALGDLTCELLETYTDDKKYSEVCWLTAHNAFSSESRGWRYAQQNLDLKEQYELGVRSFMIDLYLYEYEASLSEEGEVVEAGSDIVMCHEPSFLDGQNCLATRMLLKSGQPEPFRDFLLQVKEWLDDDPTTIITLQIESRFGEAGAEDALWNLFRELDLIIRTYAPQVEPKEIKDWPTLGDLRSADRRLVVFSDNINDGFIHTSTYRETRFDLGQYPNCEMREDNRDIEKTMPLFVLNHFYGVSIRLNGFWKDYEIINSYDYIMKRVSLCEEEHNMLPNFIVMDFVEEGTLGGALQAAIEINLQASERFWHETVHFPLNDG